MGTSLVCDDGNGSAVTIVASEDANNLAEAKDAQTKDVQGREKPGEKKTTTEWNERTSAGAMHKKGEWVLC